MQMATCWPSASAVTEVVSGRKRGVHIHVGNLSSEGAQRLEPVDEDVPVPVDALEAAVRKYERLAANDRAEAVVDARRDDQVHLPELVLEQHEDDAVRRRGSLPRDGQPG